MVLADFILVLTSGCDNVNYFSSVQQPLVSMEAESIVKAFHIRKNCRPNLIGITI